MKAIITSFLLPVFSILVSLSTAIDINAQSLSLSTGIGHSTFFDLKENQNHQYANYSGGSHQFLKLELDSYLPEVEFLSFHLKLERSSGKIESNTGSNFLFCGLGPAPIFGPNLQSNITLYRMSIGVMPINLKVYKDIRFRIGGEVSRIYNSKLTDIVDETNGTNDIIFFQPNEDEELIRDLGAGVIFELQFGKFEIGNDLLIIPVYNSSVSLLDEVKTGFHTRTFRQSLGIAVKWNLKPKIKG